MLDDKQILCPAAVRSWPHAPPHSLAQTGTYMVTAGTYLKEHHFRSVDRLDTLLACLLEGASRWGWEMEAWAAFSNHYHFVARSHDRPGGASNLSTFLKGLHERTARYVNTLDGTPGRRVWFNFRETRLTYERSYLARLAYVHQNPVRHGLVRVASQYPWCSAAEFERAARPALIRTIYGFKTDRLRVWDEFEPAGVE